MFSVNGAGFWTSGVIVVRLLFGTVSRLCVHDVVTCTYSKALSELNIASNSAEVSPNKEAAHFPLKSADPESSTGKFSLPVPFTFGTNTLFRESDI